MPKKPPPMSPKTIPKKTIIKREANKITSKIRRNRRVASNKPRKHRKP